MGRHEFCSRYGLIRAPSPETAVVGSTVPGRTAISVVRLDCIPLMSSLSLFRVTSNVVVFSYRSKPVRVSQSHAPTQPHHSLCGTPQAETLLASNLTAESLLTFYKSTHHILSLSVFLFEDDSVSSTSGSKHPCFVGVAKALRWK